MQSRACSQHDGVLPRGVHGALFGPPPLAAAEASLQQLPVHQLFLYTLCKCPFFVLLCAGPGAQLAPYSCLGQQQPGCHSFSVTG